MENSTNQRNGDTLDQVVPLHFVSPWLETVKNGHSHPDIQKHVDNFNCDFCQCDEIPCKEMGLLPERNLIKIPWYEIAVNLIGQWTAKTDQFNCDFYALTCIDTTTNVVELTCIETKSSDASARKFENTCLA